MHACMLLRPVCLGSLRAYAETRGEGVCERTHGGIFFHVCCVCPSCGYCSSGAVQAEQHAAGLSCTPRAGLSCTPRASLRGCMHAPLCGLLDPAASWRLRAKQRMRWALRCSSSSRRLPLRACAWATSSCSHARSRVGAVRECCGVVWFSLAMSPCACCCYAWPGADHIHIDQTGAMRCAHILMDG